MKKLLLASALICFTTAAPCMCFPTYHSTETQPSKGQLRPQKNEEDITPPTPPEVTRWADPFITADFIWWKAEEDGLEYAFNGAGQNPNVDANKGSVHHPHFGYEPGFKVGGGLKFRHNNWDLFAQYTWLHVNQDNTHNSVERSADGNSNVFSNILIPGSAFAIGFGMNTYSVAEANASFGMHFNALDLELGRSFWISRWLSLRPFAGMKFSWINQDFNVDYKETQSTPSNSYDVRMKLENFAVGIRAGLNTAWFLWKKWCIFGELALSGLWNDFDSTRKDILTMPASAPFIQNHIDKHIHALSAVIEWSLGLRFEQAFHHNDFMFMLQAGWEEQIWLNQNQFVMFPNHTPANLNFEGLTIKAGFYF